METEKETELIKEEVTEDKEASVPENAQEIELKRSYELSLEDGESAFFTFTPEVTGDYSFYSEGDDDTYGVLYTVDSEGELEVITSNDDGDDDTNFYIKYTLEAGTTYYLEAYGYSKGAADMTVYMKKISTLSLSSDQDQFYDVKRTDATTLNAEATTDSEDGISYEWSYYDYDASVWLVIEADDSRYSIQSTENGSSLTINPGSYYEYGNNNMYYCKAIVDGTEDTLYFYVYTEDAGQNITLEETYFEDVDYKSDLDVNFSVESEVEAGFELQIKKTGGYLVVDEDDYSIEKTSSGYCLKLKAESYPSTANDYRLIAMADGNKCVATFSVHLDPLTKVEKVTEDNTLEICIPEYSYCYYEFTPEMDGVYKFTITAPNTIDAYVYRFEGEEKIIEECWETAGEDYAESLTLEKGKTYLIKLYAYYGASGELTVSSQALSVSGRDYQVRNDEALEISPEITAKYPDNLTYKWYRRVWDDEEWEDYYDLLPEETGATLNLPAGSYTCYSDSHYDYYKLVVSDGTHQEEALFKVNVSYVLINGFPPSDGDTVIETTDVHIGDQVTLSCGEIENLTGDALDFQWLKKISEYSYSSVDERGQTYTFEMTEDTPTKYMQKISYIDNSGEKRHFNLYYSLSMADGIQILDGLYTEDQYVEGLYNEDVTLSVIDGKSEERTSELQYTWYRKVYNQEKLRDEYIQIDGEGSSISVPVLSWSSTDYKCKVSAEGYLSKSIYFYVECEDYKWFGISSIEYGGASIFGDRYTATVESVEGASMEDVTFQWYKADSYDDEHDPLSYKLIEGVTGASYSFIASADTVGTYKVVVSSGYDSNYSTFTCKATSFLYSANTYVETLADQSALLRVSAYSLSGGKLSYQWYLENPDTEDYEMISGATKASYTTDPAKQTDTYMNYKCHVKDTAADGTVFSETDIYYSVKAYKFDVDFRNSSHYLATYGKDFKDSIKITGDYSDLNVDWYLDGEPLESKGLSVTVPAALLTDLDDTYKLSYRATVDGFIFSASKGIGVKDTLSCAFTSITLDAKYGTEFTLDPEASTVTSNDITYKWYLVEDGEETLCGEGATLTATAAKPDYYYRCDISDGLSSTEVDFNIEVTKINAEGKEPVFVKYGEDITLTAVVPEELEDLTYQWQKYEWSQEEGEYVLKDIEGANGPEYTVSCNTPSTGLDYSTQYLCKITSGEFSETLRFFVYTGTTLVALYDSNKYPDYNESCTLSVVAATSTGNKLNYQWYRMGSDADDLQLIEGADKASYTIEAKGYQSENERYCCIVSDGVNEIKLSQRVSVDILNVNVPENYVTVKSGETATLKVEAESVIGQISYQWQTAVYDNEEDSWAYHYVDIEGATSPELTVNPEDYTMDPYGDRIFQCIIKSGPVTRTISFEVSVGNSGSESKYEYESLYPYREDKVTLSPKTDMTGNLDYTWYEYNEDFHFWQPLADVSGTSMIIDMSKLPKDQDECRYKCVISNGLKELTITYNIEINCIFDWNRLSGLTTLAGNDKTIGIVITDRDSSAYKYQWYKNDNHNLTKISGATNASYTIPAAQLPAEGIYPYTCEVSDGTHSVYITQKLRVYEMKGTLIPGETQTVSLARDSSGVMYAFTPSETAYYRIYSLGDYSTNALLYDQDMSVISDFDDMGMMGNFNLTYKLNAGQTYYFRIYERNEEEASFTVCLEKSNSENDSRLEIGDYTKEYEACLGEDVTLELPENESWVYQWYLNIGGEYVQIQGANEASYTVPAATYDLRRNYYTGYTNSAFACAVSTADGKKHAMADIAITYSSLKASVAATEELEYTEDGFASLEEGQEISLSVSAESMRDDAEITYDWYAYASKSDTDIVAQYDELGDQPTIKWTQNGYKYNMICCAVNDGLSRKIVLFRTEHKEKTIISIADAEVFLEKTTYTYTGSAIKPFASVALGDTVLDSESAYKVSYANNIKVGTATVTITGIGDYEGTLTATFKILCTTPKMTKAANASTGVSLAWSEAKGMTSTDKYRILRKEEGGKFVKLTDVSSTTLKYTDKTAVSGKTYYYTVRCMNSAGSYISSYDSTGICTLYLSPIATSKVTLANASTGITVKWTAVSGATGYKILRKTGSGSYTTVKTITSASTVSYTDTGAATNGTKYTYSVRAYKKASNGTTYYSYYSSSTGTVTYRVTAPTISSLTPGSLRMTVKWDKNSKATGYQIQYSTSSTFASGNKTVTVTSASTVSKTITGLTKGKKYYVRIRAYKTVGSAKYYSAWSAKKYTTSK